MWWCRWFNHTVCGDIDDDCCVDNENEGNVTAELLLGSEEVGSLKEPRFHVFHILQQVLVKVADTYA